MISASTANLYELLLTKQYFGRDENNKYLVKRGQEHILHIGFIVVVTNDVYVIVSVKHLRLNSGKIIDKLNRQDCQE